MFLTADKIHNGETFLPNGSVVEVSTDGTIIAIHASVEGKEVVHHAGILCPGFVNTHCHLELSHLVGKIEKGTGLIPFLQQVMQYRFNASESEKEDARSMAFQSMLRQGIVAVGDIANTTDSLLLRATDRMHFQSFVEATGFVPEGAEKRFADALMLYKRFNDQERKIKILRESIVPHAPYSVSENLFNRIGKHGDAGLPITIHNQECAAEDEFYISKQGLVNDLLKGFEIDASHFEATGCSSLASYLHWLPAATHMIFVHNTFTTAPDIRLAEDYFSAAFWCLCPNANLYIEGRLPDVEMIRANTKNICLGTDSLASNDALSILAEMRTLKKHCPNLEIETLLQWATSNGAKALQMDAIIGSISVGKTPGILLLVEDAFAIESQNKIRRIV